MSLELRTMMVANPRAAGGVLGKRWKGIAAELAGRLGAFHHRFTRERGDATVLTRQAIADRFELIVAVGGDGTINEVANGFFDERGHPARSAALGVLHFGTGGDFCRTAGIARKLGAAVEALKGRSCRALDVGQVEFVDHDGCAASRYFVNVASFGLSGLVDSIVEQSSKGLGGRVGFAVATMRAMRQYRAQETELTLDDNLPQRVRIQTVAVANGQYFGGGMRIAPDAQLDDGRLDVVVVDPLSTVDLLRHGHRVYRGTHLGLPFVHHSLAEQVHARPHRSGEQIWLDVDGEALGRLPARFTLCPSALQLKCSPSPVARPFDERTPPTASGAATGASDGVPA